MADTFVKIATVTVGAGGQSSIQFTSIPSTYTDLCVKTSLRTDRNTGSTSNQMVTFNGNTTSYSGKYVQGNGSTASSASNGTAAIDAIPATQATDTASIFGNAEYYIPNYADSKYKSTSIDAVNENNATAAVGQLNAGLWSNTAAITSITITPFGGFNFVQYSTATLYGILKA